MFTQTSLFEYVEEEHVEESNPILDSLEEINPLEMTPMEALNYLYDLSFQFALEYRSFQFYFDILYLALDIFNLSVIILYCLSQFSNRRLKLFINNTFPYQSSINS